MGKLRGIVAKIFLYTLFGLLILSFAVWGIGDMFRGRTSAPVVAEVGSMQVTQEEFRRAFSAEFNRLQQMLGGGLDIDDARSFGLPDQILADLVSRRLYDAEANRLGLTVPEDQIRQAIFTTPAFQNQAGQFDRFRYEQVLRANQLSEGELVQRLRHDIARDRIVSAVVAGMAAPQGLAEGLYAYREETRSADYLLVERAGLELPGEPDEAELLALYEERIEEFQAPEYRELTWVHIDPAALAGDHQAGDDALREAYERRMNEFEQPERRAVEQILFDEEAEAQAALQRLAEGEDFGQVAEEETGEPPIDLGTVARNEMPAALASAVFSLEEGAVSEPVESAFGWHLLRVTAVEEGSVTAFEDVRDQLQEDLGRHEAIESAIALANRLDDIIAGGASIEEAAEDAGLPPQQLEAVDRQGRDRAGNMVTGIPEPERFLSTAFATRPGDESLLVETEDGGFFMVRVEGVIPPTPRPFEEVRETTVEYWEEEQRGILAFERADALAERLRGGEDIQELAEEEGLPLRRADALRRGANQPSRELAEQIFEIAPGEVVVASAQGGAVVAVLSEIQAADAAASPERLADLRQRAGGALQQDMESLFRQALERSYGVSVNQQRIDDAMLDF